MKQKELFITALNTLFWSWGSEAPAEVAWGCNDLLVWYETEYNVILGIRFNEDCTNYEDVIETLRKL
jgi:hypothetical protein